MTEHLHTKLNISFPELGALLGTREMLKLGLLEHTPDKCLQPGKHTFNMDVSAKMRDCGTIACIGGTMAMLMGMTDTGHIYAYVIDSDGGLHDLFFPPREYWYGAITAEDTILAIDNFITSGRPQWDTILEGRR